MCSVLGAPGRKQWRQWRRLAPLHRHYGIPGRDLISPGRPASEFSLCYRPGAPGPLPAHGVDRYRPRPASDLDRYGAARAAPHDVYFSTGETVGTARAQFPDCGIPWRRIRPPVCLERWPYTHDPTCEAFTTVSSWWSHDWVKDARGVLFDNNKRVSFMDFVELPRLTSQKLELALCLGNKPHDFEDRQMLERHGWRVRHGHEVAGTPEMYQAYVQRSRGEFSCAKPTCMKFQGAWVSDRTLCYLASGKPVVVQHTGPSAFLPNGEGMFRFSTAEEAMGAFEAINANYQWHCRKAREITEAYFDSVQIAECILNGALHEQESAMGVVTE